MVGWAISQHQPTVATHASGQRLMGGKDIQSAIALAKAINHVLRCVAGLVDSEAFGAVDAVGAGELMAARLSQAGF